MCIYTHECAFVKVKMFGEGKDESPLVLIDGHERHKDIDANDSWELLYMSDTYDDGISRVQGLLRSQQTRYVPHRRVTSVSNDTSNPWFLMIVKALEEHSNVDIIHGNHRFAGIRTGPTAAITTKPLCIDLSTRALDVRIVFADESDEPECSLMCVDVIPRPDFRRMADHFLFGMLTPDDVLGVGDEEDIDEDNYCGWCRCEFRHGQEDRCLSVQREEDMEMSVGRVLSMIGRMLRKCPLCKVSCMADCCKLCPHIAARKIQWAWKKHMYNPKNPRQIERLKKEFEELVESID